MRTLCTLIILLTSNFIFGQRDSLDKFSSLTKEDAINIAKQEGFYWEGEFPFSQKVELDSNQWVITCSKFIGVTIENCHALGGCYVYENVLIIIDADTQRIIKKSKFEQLIGNMEGPTPILIDE